MGWVHNSESSLVHWAVWYSTSFLCHFQGKRQSWIWMPKSKFWNTGFRRWRDKNLKLVLSPKICNMVTIAITQLIWYVLLIVSLLASNQGSWWRQNKKDSCHLFLIFLQTDRNFSTAVAICYLILFSKTLVIRNCAGWFPLRVGNKFHLSALFCPYTFSGEDWGSRPGPHWLAEGWCL